jgi:N-acetylglucosamine kinase-like BadF-type ATPase
MRAFDSNIVVMAGTGCIAFGESGEKRCVVGGWGKEIGDKGCGYSLGMSAIQATLLQLDSNLPELSPIAKRISGRDTPFVFSDITAYAAARDAARAGLPKTRGDVAALVPIITECAEAGCSLSISLIERCGREIADSVISAARKIATNEVRIVVNGGMTAFSELWYEAFVSRVVEAHLEMTLLEVTNSGIENAIIYMLGEEK